MKFKLLFVLLFSTATIKPAWSPVIAGFLNEGSKYTFLGLSFNPTTIAIAGGVLLGKEIYFYFKDKIDWNKLPINPLSKNKKNHVFGGNNRKKHNLDGEDPNDIEECAYSIIREHQEKRLIRGGPQLVSKMIRKGILLVVKICALSNAIDIGTMYIQKINCKNPEHIGSTTALKEPTPIERQPHRENHRNKGKK